MIALRRRERPSLPVAQEILASFFGPSVTPSGVRFPRIEGRGAWRGARVKVDLETSNTRRSTEPFTTIELEDDLDAIVYTGGAGWSYPAYEPHAAFTAPPLAFLLDTVLAIGTEARRELAAATLRGGQSRHAEILEYEHARAKSRAQGLKIVGVLAAALSVLTFLASAMLMR